MKMIMNIKKNKKNNIKIKVIYIKINLSIKNKII